LFTQEIAMNPPETSPHTEFLDLYRAGLKSAVDLMKASLESAERLREQQLSSIRVALEEHVEAVNDLGKARTFEELLALQQKMAGSQLERVMGYWTGVCEVAGQNQTAALSQAQKQLAQARDWFNETYRLTARSTEEAASIAAAKAAPKAAPKASRDDSKALPPPPAPKRGSQSAPMHR
jgi:phasin family protein